MYIKRKSIQPFDDYFQAESIEKYLMTCLIKEKLSKIFELF